MNIFSWLPKPGRSVPLPGGFLECVQIEVSRHAGTAEGEITFRFVAAENFYDAAGDPVTLEEYQQEQRSIANEDSSTPRFCRCPSCDGSGVAYNFDGVTRYDVACSYCDGSGEVEISEA